MKIVSDCFNFVTTMLSYHIKFKIYVYLKEAATKFWFGGKQNIKQNFIYEILSSCTAIAKPKFRFWWDIMYSSKTFEKFRKINKTLAPNI